MEDVLLALAGPAGGRQDRCAEMGFLIKCPYPLEQVFETRIEVNWDAIMKEGKNRQ